MTPINLFNVVKDIILWYNADVDFNEFRHLQSERLLKPQSV